MGVYIPDYTQVIITTQILEDLYIYIYMCVCVIHLVNNAILLQYVRMYEYIR